MNTGDIILATASRNPFVHHRGIIVIENGIVCISHNTPMHRNQFGGNLIVEPLDDFVAAGRKILDVKPSCLTYADIESANTEIEAKPFNIWSWNCEQYVYWVLTCETKSPQMLPYFALTGIALIALL